VESESKVSTVSTQLNSMPCCLLEVLFGLLQHEHGLVSSHISISIL